jgi:hypothetical protein
MILRVLIACEYSGAVRRAFRAAGHYAYSCDLLPAEDDSPHHIQGDVLEIIDGWAPLEHWQTQHDKTPWDLMIAHPPCTYLSVSGLHWNKRRPERAAQTEQALDFVRLLLAAPVDRIAVENPISCISSRIRKPDQIIQPWQFGHDASKATCLWLKGLPKLALDPSKRIPGRIVGEDKRGQTIVRWGNQTDSGQNKLPPSDDRWKIRSETYAGIAEAMASQWGARQRLAAA